MDRDYIRERLGLGPPPSSDTYANRGSGKTTEMLIAALEEASKGNIVHIVCHDSSFCGYVRGIATDYAKTLKVDYKLLHFVPAASAYFDLVGSGYTKAQLYIDHFVKENGMYKDYDLERLEMYAK